MSFEFIVKADDGDCEAREGGPLSHFSKKDSSKVICIVQVYFLGLAVLFKHSFSLSLAAWLSGKAHEDSDHRDSLLCTETYTGSSKVRLGFQLWSKP